MVATGAGRGALPTVVLAVGGGAGDPERLQELPRSGGIRLAAGFCEVVAAPGSAEPALGPELRAMAFGRHLPLPVQ